MNQTQTQTILQGVIALILNIPSLIMDVIDKIETLIEVKAPKHLAKPLKIVFIIVVAIPLVIFVFLDVFFESFKRDLGRKAINEDMAFQEFLRLNLNKKFYVDNMVKMDVSLESKDFNDNIHNIYKAYTEVLMLVKELKFNVSDSVKQGLNILDSKIVILSESIYEARFSSESAGCFTMCDKTIYINLSSNSRHNILTLHHEIGHFVDLVAGFNDNCNDFLNYQSHYDYELHEAFEYESNFLRSYAKTDYQEFFAVAYEHKMTGGNMSKLKQINSITDYYLEKFRVNIEYIERCMRLDCWDY